MAQPLVDVDPLGPLAAQVGAPDAEAAEAMRRALLPRPALGRLREIAEWLAGVQGRQLHPFRRVVLASTAAAAPAEIVALAEGAGVLLRRIEPGPAADALAAGVAAADDEVDRGTDLVVLAGADPGPSPLVTVSVLTDREPVQVLPRGAAACEPDEWVRRAGEIRDARRRVSAFRDRPGLLLSELADPALTAATGFVLRASARRTALLLDGVLALAAALVAQRAAPQSASWLQVADTSPEPAHRLAADALGLRPLLQLGIGRDDGIAGVLAVPVLQAALALADDGSAG